VTPISVMNASIELLLPDKTREGAKTRDRAR